MNTTSGEALNTAEPVVMSPPSSPWGRDWVTGSALSSVCVFSWIFGKKVMLPVGVITSADHDGKNVFQPDKGRSQERTPSSTTQCSWTNKYRTDFARTTPRWPWVPRLGLSLTNPTRATT